MWLKVNDILLKAQEDYAVGRGIEGNMLSLWCEM